MCEDGNESFPSLEVSKLTWTAGDFPVRNLPLIRLAKLQSKALSAGHSMKNQTKSRKHTCKLPLIKTKEEEEQEGIQEVAASLAAANEISVWSVLSELGGIFFYI